MRYRPEIDGLRAIAVIPVILFHAGFENFAGGFVGVDVFFVISGFLITTIILSDLEKDDFNLFEFYERRARRILPALFFVCAVCIPVAWYVFLPAEMQGFARSLVAVATFTSNILFWVESGYFDTAAELKPLLHTWSLAIEEQFYIFFPLFLLLTWRLGKRWIVILLIVAFGISLAVADWGSFYKPDATFYLLPTRGWELLAGAMTAFYLYNKDSGGVPAWQAETMSILGIALIGFAVWHYNSTTRFPSIYALVPCLGTVLIIIYADQQTLIKRLLGTPVLVGIGLISYSAYLWHQPLFAFTKYAHNNHAPWWILAALSVAVFPIAYLSWRYIEQPFRNRKTFSRRTIFVSALTSSLVLTAIGLSGYLTDGYKDLWLTRQSADVARLYTVLSNERSRDLQVAAQAVSHDNGDCRFNIQELTPEYTKRIRVCHEKYDQGVVILGDSHATDLLGVVLASNNTEQFVIGITQGGCRPHSPASFCQYADFLSLVQQEPRLFSRVIYEQAGFYLLRTNIQLGSRNMFSDQPLHASLNGIYPNLDYLRLVHDYLLQINEYVPVLWFGARVEPHISDQDILRLGCEFPYRLRENQFAVFRALDVAIENLTQEKNSIEFLSQNEVFDYQFPRDFMNCENSYWTGGDHLSESGERYFGKRYDLLNHPFE